jgi:hypothetical protein
LTWSLGGGFVAVGSGDRLSGLLEGVSPGIDSRPWRQSKGLLFEEDAMPLDDEDGSLVILMDFGIVEVVWMGSKIVWGKFDLFVLGCSGNCVRILWMGSKNYLGNVVTFYIWLLQ